MEEEPAVNRFYSKNGKKDRKRIIIFTICLFISLGFWLASTMSRMYTFIVKAPLSYQNIPSDKALEVTENKTVELTIEGSGWQFLFSRVDILSTPLSLDMRNLKGNKIILPELYEELAKQFYSRVKILKASPDTLVYSFSPRMIKKIPVHLEAVVTFNKQFFYREPVRLAPDSIFVSGPRSEVEKIEKWHTKKAFFLNLDKDVKSKVYLSPNLKPNIELSATQVEVNIPVEQFTEWSMERPLELVGNDSNLNIQLFPRTCKIVYQVGLSRFSQVVPEMFGLKVDFMGTGKGAPLDVQLERNPSFVRAIKIVPDKINYVIIR